jgi:OOP family OmpA-OmpF porin
MKIHDMKENIMKKIGMIVVIIMMMAFGTAVQSEMRAGGMPELTFDKRIKDCNCTTKEVRAGAMPEIIIDKRISDCGANQKAIVTKKTKKAKVTIALNVEFATGKAIVNERYYDNIKNVADFMKDNPKSTITIEGHTDSVGNAVYNKKLSLQRAKSVRQYIIDKFGIDGKRIKAVGYGKTQPIATNDTEEGRQKNRRVEAVVETKK